MKNILKKIPCLVILKRFLFPASDPMGCFLSGFFGSEIPKTIVQIGANDGVMCDPLRPFLKTPGNYNAILIEPLPYYVEKLRQLYKSRSDVSIVQAAIGSKDETRTLYYMPPEIADTMNGNGPKNNWAHGQGSFDRETIVHWINNNSFRGEDYCKNIPFFISSIASIEIRIRPAGDIIPNVDNLLVVIDVQGFEIDVLNGINWDFPPKYIILEDDLENSSGITDYMIGKNYKYLCGDSDKLFQYAG
jgi:FkbM family methyltransferase